MNDLNSNNNRLYNLKGNTQDIWFYDLFSWNRHLKITFWVRFPIEKEDLCLILLYTSITLAIQSTSLPYKTINITIASLSYPLHLQTGDQLNECNIGLGRF